MLIVAHKRETVVEVAGFWSYGSLSYSLEVDGMEADGVGDPGGVPLLPSRYRHRRRRRRH